jgi:predicted DNA-binding protein with PD1-like motif
VVAGPEEAVIPPEQLLVHFHDGRGVLGIGTLFWMGEEPVIHIPGAAGREYDSLTGCFRKNSSVFIVIEAVIVEILGLDAHKALDKKTGIVMLEL